MKKRKELNIKSLTVEQIENELKREKYKSRYIKMFINTISALIIIFAISTLIATFITPLLEVSETTMKPSINNGDYVVAVKTQNLKRGDIVAFYHGNKILIKRVIALEGDWINIDEKGNVYLNNKQLKEDYILNKSSGDYTIDFPYQVPNNKYFVLNDESDIVIDSRNKDIDSIDKNTIIGKVVFRIWPFKKIGKL